MVPFCSTMHRYAMLARCQSRYVEISHLASYTTAFWLPYLTLFQLKAAIKLASEGNQCTAILSKCIVLLLLSPSATWDLPGNRVLRLTRAEGKIRKRLAEAWHAVPLLEIHVLWRHRRQNPAYVRMRPRFKSVVAPLSRRAGNAKMPKAFSLWRSPVCLNLGGSPTGLFGFCFRYVQK